MEEDEWFCGEVEEPEPPKPKKTPFTEMGDYTAPLDTKCVLCGNRFRGHGHNPSPLKQRGRCCNNCNNLVIAARLNAMMK